MQRNLKVVCKEAGLPFNLIPMQCVSSVISEVVHIRQLQDSD